MPAELMLWHPDHLGDAKGKLQFRHVNTLNAPVVGTPVWLGNGQAIADVYEFTCTDNTGGTATLTRECLIGGVKNPYRDVVGITAVADGSTPNLTLLPGLSIVLSASIAVGWKFRVAIYNYLEDDGSYTGFFGYGVIQSGTSSTGQRVAAKNVGDADATNCKIYVLPGFYWTGTNGAEAFVAAIANHSNPARHKLAATGTYTITFADFKDAGGGKKSCDIYVDGHKAVEDALMDGETVYQYGVAGYADAPDYLAGLAITMADTTDDPTSVTITLKVTANQAWVEFAPDSGGAPGTYANQDLTLTEASKPTGTVTASGAGFFWHREAVPDAATAGDIRKKSFRTAGLTV
jgi:hypothetical protein